MSDNSKLEHFTGIGNVLAVSPPLPEAVREQIARAADDIVLHSKWMDTDGLRRAIAGEIETAAVAAAQQERARLRGAVQWWQEKLADGVTGQDAEDMLAAFACIAASHPPPTPEDR